MELVNQDIQTGPGVSSSSPPAPLMHRPLPDCADIWSKSHDSSIPSLSHLPATLIPPPSPSPPPRLLALVIGSNLCFCPSVCICAFFLFFFVWFYSVFFHACKLIYTTRTNKHTSHFTKWQMTLIICFLKQIVLALQTCRKSGLWCDE